MVSTHLARSEVEEIMLMPMDSLPDSLSSEVTVVVELSRESATDCSTDTAIVKVSPVQSNVPSLHTGNQPPFATEIQPLLKYHQYRATSHLFTQGISHHLLQRYSHC